MSAKTKNSTPVYSKELIAETLAYFTKHSKTNTSVVAKRFKVPTKKLVEWATEAGLPLRKRRPKRPTVVHTDADIKAALSDYVNHPEMFTSAIAKKHRTCTATLTVWATRAGLKLRSRGLHKMDAPTARQKDIIEQAKILPYEVVGKRFGMTKARVGAIVKRWKGLEEPAKPPFAPGDVVEWYNGRKKEELTVIEAGLTQGTMLDSKGRTLRAFTWNTRGRLPRKIGVNEKYVVKATNGHALATNGSK